MRIYLLLATVAVMSLMTVPARSQSSNPLVDNYVRHQMWANHLTGVSVAVVRAGHVVYAKGYGSANIEFSNTAAANTVYPLASLSKQFTAAAVMLLVQDGKLDVDSPIAPILTKVKLPDTWSGVTVRELLNQTSGLPNYTQYIGNDTEKDPFLKTYTAQDIVDAISAKPLSFIPGSSYEYCNTNYYLLAQVVASVSGEDFNTFLTDRLFKPLGMNSTGDLDPSAIVPHRASTYIRSQGKTYDNFLQTDPSYTIGAGGVQSSVVDMAKWDAALYTNSPLLEKSKRMMWTPPKLLNPGTFSYGFGWIMDQVNNHELMWHNGAIPGGCSWMGRFINDKLTVVVLSNSFDVDNMATNTSLIQGIGRHLAGLYNPGLIEIDYRTIAANPHVDPVDVEVCREALAGISDGHADPFMYTDSAAKTLFPDAIDATTKLLSAYGPLKNVEALATTTKGQYRVVTCRGMFGTTPVVYDFYLVATTRKIDAVLPKH